MRLVVAVHSREVKTALFLALSGIEALEIVATATSTAELVSYCRAFRPDVAVVESDLPGRPMDETLKNLDDANCSKQIFLIESPDSPDVAIDLTSAELFRDVDQMVAAIPNGAVARPEEER